jgi:DNA polymerase-3 subunit epsilon
MTGGQAALKLDGFSGGVGGEEEEVIRRLSPERPPLRVVRANQSELQSHDSSLDAIERASGSVLWRSLGAKSEE